MDNRGYTNISDSVIFIVAFAVVAIVIGVSIYLFYAHDVDVRALQSDILNKKIVEGIRLDGLGDIDDFDIYQVANIDRSVVNNGYFYLRILIFKDGEEIRSVVDGNIGYEVNCNLPGKKLPECHKKIIFVNGYEVEVLTGSNYDGGTI